jgi:hypothetical protein
VHDVVLVKLATQCVTDTSVGIHHVDNLGGYLHCGNALTVLGVATPTVEVDCVPANIHFILQLNVI